MQKNKVFENIDKFQLLKKDVQEELDIIKHQITVKEKELHN